ncbi:hypothetical protein [Seleniivibrio woodruffii]|uniref:Fibronectin type-III domain-containing protein n=1 Tax=Seleniivibrio woodruffii TaxID=1078050 RepID=A0A4R1KCC0_9BACT|nr:hypothetical protein [Seleniivibrio woodruffii]TCK61603.1 hypothetical protein C8D98_0105 [Seleniivibrio woodruffii]TVZ35282.1 hypothetical protein OF66_0888 [Seleniivibrio woodruffii]
MKLSTLIKLILVSLLTVACGGGTTTSKSKNSVELSMQFENSTSGKTGFHVGNFYIGKVTISYSTAGEQTHEVDATAAAADKEPIVIEGLSAGKTYTFAISAEDENESVICAGTADVEIMPNTTTDAELVCGFADKNSMELAALNMLKTAFSGDADYNTLSSYVAQDFGVMDGMDRDTFINELMTKNSDFKYDEGIEVASVSVSGLDERMKRDGSSMAGMYDIRVTFSDGSYEIVTAGFVKEEGSWKIKGNGIEHDLELRHSSVRGYRYVDQTEPFVISGISAEYYPSEDQYPLEGFNLSGTGIDTAVFEKMNPDSHWFGLSEENHRYTFDNGEGLDVLDYYFSPMEYNIVPYNGTDMGAYTPLTAEYSDSSTETYAVRGPKPALELPPSMFPQLRMEMVEDGQEYRFDFHVTLPDDYTPSGLRISIDAGNEDFGIHEESRIALTNLSFSINDISELMQFYGYYFVIGITATDSFMRDYTVYYSFNYLMAQKEYGLSNSAAKESVFKTPGTGGFYGFLENETGYDTNRYHLSGLIWGGAAYDDSVYTYGYLSRVERDGGGNGGMDFIVSKLTGGENPVSKAISFVNYPDIQSQAVYSKLTDSSGNFYIVSNLQTETGSVSVMKINSDLSDISWIKEYRSPSGLWTKTAGAVVASEGGTEYMYVATSDSDGVIDLIKLNIATGAAESSLRFSFKDNSGGDAEFRLTAVLLIKPLNRIGLMGRIFDGPSRRLGVVICDTAMNYDSSYFIDGVNYDESPVIVDDPISDSSGNIYYLHQYTNSETGTMMVRIAKLHGSVTGAGYGITGFTHMDYMGSSALGQYGIGGFSRFAEGPYGTLFLLFGYSGQDWEGSFSTSNSMLKVDMSSLYVQDSIILPPVGAETDVIPATNYSALVLGSAMVNVTSGLNIGGMTAKPDSNSIDAQNGTSGNVIEYVNITVSKDTAMPVVSDKKSSSGYSLRNLPVRFFNYILDQR